MNRHLKRGLVAALIAFSLVLIGGALSIYFDPPIDVPSVGYYALGLLVKAGLALGIGASFIIFALVGLGSAMVANAEKSWVRLVILGSIIIFGSAYAYLSEPQKHAAVNQEKEYLKEVK